MPTPTKRPASKKADEDAKPAKGAKPYLRFYHSAGLRAESIALLAAIEEAPDPLPHRAALADLTAKLIDSGMDYYFLRPLRLAKVGFIALQSAHMASAGASRALATVTRNVLLRMDRSQLLAVCSHVRHLME